MKETVVYRSEFLVFDCPYCSEEYYKDIEDDMGEGFIPEDGRKMECPKCHKTFLLLPSDY